MGVGGVVVSSKPPTRANTEPEGDESVSLGSSYILPGGKVDPDALAKAVHDAQAAALEAGQEAGDDEALRTVTFTLRRDLGKRLDKYLTDRITFMSRNQLQKLITDGGVTVNGRSPKPSTKLAAGDVVEVVIPPPPPPGVQPEDIPLDVMFEDEHLIVLNKQADIIVHPARSHLSGTLINALAFHFKHRSAGGLSTVGGEFARPGVVHRLDRDTTGCIVFAKQDQAHWKLGHQFEHRRVDKRYLALVHGIPEPASDVIELPIGPHPSREKGYREKHVVRHDELGKPSVTIYRVRETYRPRANHAAPAPVAARTPVNPGWRAPDAAPPSRPRSGTPSELALVELELKTGRTHQIRVHLSHLGWPIVGDDMYGGRPLLDADGRPILERQALHAATLAFRHPADERPLVFSAPMRGPLRAGVEFLRRHSIVERLAAPGATVPLDG